jgi:hypothetical protein
MRDRATIDRIVAQKGFEATPDNVCLLDRDNRIIYCNASWDRFARDNGGDQATFEHVNGLNVLSVCADALKGFYRQMFNQCRTTRLTISHGYSCSSPEAARVARMTLRPHADYISVQHTILSETKHPDTPLIFGEQYITKGLIRMCANCRRTFNRETSSWEWIPQLLVALPSNATHGLCKPCTVFYFGPDEALQIS